MTDSASYLKRKQRLSSSSSNSKSPDSKRVRNRSDRSGGSGEDEILYALDMTAAFGEQIKEVLEKVKKLDTIEDKLSAIDSKMAGLEAKMCVLTTRQDECERKAQDALKRQSL